MGTKLGINSFGPAGVTGVVGLLLSYVPQLVSQLSTVLPPEWANALSALVALGTMVGIFKVPNHVQGVTGGRAEPTTERRLGR
jgi:hypothetical protein